MSNITEVSRPTQWKPGQSGNLNRRPVGTRQAFSAGFHRDLAIVKAEPHADAEHQPSDGQHKHGMRYAENSPLASTMFEPDNTTGLALGWCLTPARTNPRPFLSQGGGLGSSRCRDLLGLGIVSMGRFPRPRKQMAEGFLGLARVFTRSHRPIHSQLLIGKSRLASFTPSRT